MKILFIVNAVITGGAERHTLDLAADLRAAGIDAKIFAGHPAAVPLSDAAYVMQPARRRRFVARSIELAAVIEDQHIDLVVAVNQRPLALAYAAMLWTRRRPRIAEIFHTTDLRTAREEWMQLVYNLMFNRADLVVFVSENQKAHWLKRGMRPRRPITIVNGIDVDKYALVDAVERTSARSEFGIDEQDYVIGCTAMLRREKNHLQLVQAIAGLRARNIPGRALIVGEGEMRAEIQALAIELGIEKYVTLLGLRRDVRHCAAAFDVGVLCSTAETLSLAALEIMSTGVPMVLSDLAGASEVVDGRNGLLFPVGDVAGLIESLAKLYPMDVRVTAGAAARATVESKFTRSRMVRSYVDEFQRLASWTPPNTLTLAPR